MRIFAHLDIFAVKLIKAVTTVHDAFIGMLSLDSVRSINIKEATIFIMKTLVLQVCR